eukprot:1179997-Prorocentrum_minimum.AAC.1
MSYRCDPVVCPRVTFASRPAQVGPLFGRLQRGEGVTLPDGTVVTQRDVCGNPSPGVNGPSYSVSMSPPSAALRAVN